MTLKAIATRVPTLEEFDFQFNSAQQTLLIDAVKISPLEKDELDVCYDKNKLEPQTAQFFIWFIKSYFPTGFKFQTIAGQNKQTSSDSRVTKHSKFIIDNRKKFWPCVYILILYITLVTISGLISFSNQPQFYTIFGFIISNLIYLLVFKKYEKSFTRFYQDLYRLSRARKIQHFHKYTLEVDPANNELVYSLVDDESFVEKNSYLKFVVRITNQGEIKIQEYSHGSEERLKRVLSFFRILLPTVTPYDMKYNDYETFAKTHSYQISIQAITNKGRIKSYGLRHIAKLLQN